MTFNTSGRAAAFLSFFVACTCGSPAFAAETTGAPVILNESFATSIEWAHEANALGWTTLLQATNAPQSFQVMGLPPGTSLMFDRIVWGGQLHGPQCPAGIHPIQITATNGAGSTTKAIEVTVHPSITHRWPDKERYVVGETVRLAMSFNGPVVVTGAPSTPVANGRAVYASGSGTDTLVFTYTLQPGDVGVFSAFAVIELEGGSITHAGTGLAARTYGPVYHWSDRSGEFTVVGPPVIESATTASATVGNPFSYTITARNEPKAFNARGLPAGLTVNTATGVISGVPTAAGMFSITLEATNDQVPEPGTATLALTVAAAPSTPPTEPPPPDPEPEPEPGPEPEPEPPALEAQTISFATVPPIVVGQAITISAAASSGLPVALSLVSGDATLNGVQLIVNTTGAVRLRATQPGDTRFAPATADLTVSAAQASQSVEFVSPVSTIVIGQPVPLSATASSGLPVTFSVVSGNATISGNLLTITGPGPVVVRATQAGNASTSPASSDVTITGAVRAAQTLALAPLAAEILSDGSLTLDGTASSGLPVAFELVSGPAAIDGNTLRPTAASGTVVVRARQAGNDMFAPVETTHTITILPAGRLINLSSRLMVRDGDASRAFIAGFVVSGGEPKRMLVRAIGPALGAFGVATPLPDPRLRVFDQAGRQIAENDDWSGGDVAAASGRVGAFGLASGGDDAALLLTLAPGAYSLHVDANGGEGIALAEIYDASDVPALEAQQVVNLSTRGFVGTNDAVLTAGFVVNGGVPKRVLIRGVGPGLAAYGVTDALTDPMLQVFAGATVVAENDDWERGVQPAASGAEIATAAASAGAFPLNNGSKDAALILTLQPGAYTAIVRGANDTTGAGLVEVYQLSNDGP